MSSISIDALHPSRMESSASRTVVPPMSLEDPEDPKRESFVKYMESFVKYMNSLEHYTNRLRHYHDLLEKSKNVYLERNMEQTNAEKELEQEIDVTKDELDKLKDETDKLKEECKEYTDSLEKEFENCIIA